MGLKEDKLIEMYRDKGIIWGRELLIRPIDALSFLETCRDWHLVILGLDFYFQDENGIVEASGESADFSSIANDPDAVQASYTAARRLLTSGLVENYTWVSVVTKESQVKLT